MLDNQTAPLADIAAAGLEDEANGLSVVMIVDDTPHNLHLLQEIVRDLGQRTAAFAKAAGEEVVPGGEPVMRQGRVAFKILHERRHGLLRIPPEPSGLGIVVQDGCRLRRLQESAPVVQDLLQLAVDAGVEKGGGARRGAHGPIQNGIDGEADQAGLVEFRGLRQDVVQENQHVGIVPHPGTPHGIVLELGGVRDLLEHEREEHGERRIVFNQLLELLDHGMQRGFRRGGIGLAEDALVPGVQDALIGGKPFRDLIRDGSWRRRLGEGGFSPGGQGG